MCNAYRLNTPAHAFYEVLEALGLPLVAPDRGRAPNLEPMPFTRPTDVLPVLRAVAPGDPAAGLELARLRWGLIPGWHRGGVKDFKLLCTNARAETVQTTRPFREAYARRRCLAPADGFFEWTGPKGAKTKWLFERADGDWFAFAGLWERWIGPDGPLESFSILTCAAGPDAAPLHDRQPVILERGDWARWLDPAAPPPPLTAGPAGALRVVRADAAAAPLS